MDAWTRKQYAEAEAKLDEVEAILSDARGRGSFGSRSDRRVPEAGWASGTCLNLSHQR